MASFFTYASKRKTHLWKSSPATATSPFFCLKLSSVSSISCFSFQSAAKTALSSDFFSASNVVVNSKSVRADLASFDATFTEYFLLTMSVTARSDFVPVVPDTSRSGTVLWCRASWIRLSSRISSPGVALSNIVWADLSVKVNEMSPVTAPLLK